MSPNLLFQTSLRSNRTFYSGRCGTTPGSVCLRFDRRAQTETAAELIDRLDKRGLAELFRRYGEEGNAIGGFVFEWRDEWWKYKQIENLDVQDNNASWSNQAYLFDWAIRALERKLVPWKGKM